MATPKNQYCSIDSVPLNMCLHDADHPHSGRPDHSDIANGASLAHGVRCAALWDHLPFVGVPSVVRVG